MKHYIKRFLANMLMFTNDPEKLRGLSARLSRLNNRVNEKIRRLSSSTIEIPDIFSYDRNKKLEVLILENHPPWSSVALKEYKTPGMIKREECQYYSYIGQFYSGKGEAVELGPWLGRSTFYILEGLLPNPSFSGKKLNVYDDFVWRASWMDDKVLEEERLYNHQDFMHIFDKHTVSLKDSIRVKKRKITDYDGNDDVPQLAWNGDPVEIMYVDCGRTYEANEAWYRIFSHFFIPDTTLIIMQDWRTFNDIPVKWYNQTTQFTESKGSALELIHELKHGGIGTFLYRGT